MSNSLVAVHTELVAEWSEKNLPLTPDSITFGSNKKVWWKGACGHEWQTSVKARSNGEKCPICSGARVIVGINDLATLEPLLAKQWSKKNKIKPTEVSIGSHKKVIWRCKKGHEWEVAVKSRTINKTGCQYCSHNYGSRDSLRHPCLLRAGSARGQDLHRHHEPPAAAHDGHRLLRHADLCRASRKRGRKAAPAHGRSAHPGRREAVLKFICKSPLRAHDLHAKGFFDFGAARVTARAGNSSDRSSRRSFSVRSPR